MQKRTLFSDKRGIDSGEEDSAFPTLIRILLLLMFIMLLMTFVWRSSSGALIYEQAYAKEIALLLNEARPGTTISLNYAPAYALAERNHLVLADTIRIDQERNIVTVDLGGRTYSHSYVREHTVDYSFREGGQEELVLVIS